MGETVRLPSNDNGSWMPRLFRRPKIVEVIDGERELAVAYEIFGLLIPLKPTQQARCLQHVSQILEERQQQLEAFDNNLRGVE